MAEFLLPQPCRWGWVQAGVAVAGTAACLTGVGTALRPGGQACFVDTGAGEATGEEILVGQPAPSVRRVLDDGTVHRIVKVFLDPEELARALHGIGWSTRVWPVGAKLIAGVAAPSHQASR